MHESVSRAQDKTGLDIGGVKLAGNVLLAPLAGVTDVGFRVLARRYGASLTCTEMVSGKGLMYNNANTKSLLVVDECESPSAVQLFGSEPDIIAMAVSNPLLSGFDIIDINMGCPMEKIVKNGEGSALLKNPKLASRIISAAVSAAGGRPVTVKFRLGYDEEIVAPAFAEMCQRSGASAVTIHGRTRKQMYGGRADYAPIKEAVRAVTIPVIANGDIKCREDYLRALELTGAAGVMIGRASLGCPEVFSQILGRAVQVDKCSLALAHMQRLLECYSDRFVTLNMRKHVGWYFSGVRGGKQLKQIVNCAQSTEEIVQAIAEFKQSQAN